MPVELIMESVSVAAPAKPFFEETIAVSVAVFPDVTVSALVLSERLMTGTVTVTDVSASPPA